MLHRAGINQYCNVYIFLLSTFSVKGRNIVNKSNIWNNIIGKIINVTINCPNNKIHCLLLQIVEPFTQGKPIHYVSIYLF